MRAGAAKGNVQRSVPPLQHNTLLWICCCSGTGISGVCNSLLCAHSYDCRSSHLNRQKHLHSGRLQELCKFSGSCLFALQHKHWNCRAWRAVRCGVLDGMSWACAWLQSQPFDKTSELCYFFVLELYLDWVLILNTLKRLSNTNMDEIT